MSWLRASCSAESGLAPPRARVQQRGRPDSPEQDHDRPRRRRDRNHSLRPARRDPHRPDLRRTRRPGRDRPGPRRDRHRPHLRHPGAHAPARARGRRPHRPGPHRHGQDLRVRRPAAAPPRRTTPRRRREPDGTPRGARHRADPRAVHPGHRATSRRARAARRRSGSLAIYGGRAYEPQIAALQKGVDVVVGTPGRLLDLAKQGHLVLGKVSVLVLDEADEMLDLGFLPDIERIMRHAARQAPDDAVLGHHARPDHHAGAHVPDASRRTSAPRSPTRAGARAHQPARLPRTRAWTRPRCSPACCRPRAAASP